MLALCLKRFFGCYYAVLEFPDCIVIAVAYLILVFHFHWNELFAQPGEFPRSSSRNSMRK